ncbi:SUKH-4 family immunity protein [Streptomyces sp. NPDC051771]|uniref:SUKH-4 family immunity protein n=1 Tax=Streptomyces sp. NPDC051771 TaxID=3154847 RepID=UPI00342DCC49
MSPPSVTADEVRAVFGLTGVVHFPHDSALHDSAPHGHALHHRLDRRTAHLLSTVGLPDTEWFMSKASLRADDPVDVPRWYARWGAVPEECRGWLVLALFADTTLALDPASGTVHALGDGPTEMTHSPLHRDVESLVHALTAFETLRQDLPDDDRDAVSRRVDALRARITAHDPLPFAHEESPWHLVLEEVADGIW